MTDSVIVSAHLTLTIAGGGVYELAGLQATFQANGINVCACSIAVGRNENGDLVDLDISPGAEALITFEGTFGEEIASNTGLSGIPVLGEFNYGTLIKDNKPFTLFRGIVDDWGPTTLQAGGFGIQVSLFGRLAYLASGTFSTSNIMPKSMYDTRVAFAFGQGVNDPELIRYDEALGSNGFWNAIENAFIRVAADGPTQETISANSLTKTIYDTFGSTYNAEAAALLQDMDGQLDWTIPEDLIHGFIIHLNEQLRSNWFYGSFMSALINIGEQLKFSIIENGQGIGVVPYHPFWTRTDSFRRLTPNTWNSFQWIRGDYSSYAGSVLTQSTGNESTLQDVAEDLIVGLAKIDALSYGRVHVGPAPGFLAAATQTMRAGGDNEARVTGGTEYIRSQCGDDYAMLQALDLNFASRRCRVSSPCLRTDIGPLSAVAVQFPDIPEITSSSGTSEFGVYGSVQAVTLSIDASRNYAQTIYDIGYVRSLIQQSQIIDQINPQHPFFANNYTGARLDQDPFTPGFTIGF